MPLPDALKTPLSAVFGLLTAGTSNGSMSISTNQQSEAEKLISPGGKAPSEKVDFRIEGMTCGACVEVRKFLPDGVYSFPKNGICSMPLVARPLPASAVGSASIQVSVGVAMGTC
jgi:hypothetical protein